MYSRIRRHGDRQTPTSFCSAEGGPHFLLLSGANPPFAHRLAKEALTDAKGEHGPTDANSRFAVMSRGDYARNEDRFQAPTSNGFLSQARQDFALDPTGLLNRIRSGSDSQSALSENDVGFLRCSALPPTLEWSRARDVSIKVCCQAKISTMEPYPKPQDICGYPLS